MLGPGNGKPLYMHNPNSEQRMTYIVGRISSLIYWLSLILHNYEQFILN